jgi:signal transduction histidine kinase/CheY-like chemotaxis protein/HPt (histidine-containing phosphotransfer) domain-containing protein
VLLTTRLRFWPRPDPASVRAGREGELFAAKVRIGVGAVVTVPALGQILAQPSDLEPWVGIAGALLTLLLGVAVRSFARRREPPLGLGFFTCVLDVTLVSAAFTALVVSGHALAVTNGRVLWGIYFLALGFTCLRQDVRMCAVAGFAVLAEYAALVAWALAHRATSGLDQVNANYGVFRLDNQLSRLLILALATAINIAIVHQSRYLRRQRDQAEEASHAKSEFLANMSHEIRTPLNAVLGMLSLALDTPLTSAQYEYVSTARKSGAALLAILNDMLDISKIEAGRLEIEIVPFDLRACLADAMGVLASKAESQGLAFHLEVQDGVPEAVLSDAARLRQILVNLLDNAIKFSTAGEVRLEVFARTVREGDTEILFAVRDQGIGIPADRMDRLFQPFGQVDPSLSRLYGGTGLGLVISRRLVERLGGRMWVESEPGRGSTFFFTLRCRTTATRARIHDPGDDPAGRPFADGLPLRILLAEDNSINQRVALLMLDRLGYRADLAGNGEEVLQALHRQPYDLILMDVQMPGIDGLEATRRIRAELPPERQPRIVAMTANVLPEQRTACLAAGMDDFLQKPVDFADLRAALDRAGREGQENGESLAPPMPVEGSFDPAKLAGLRQLGALAGRPLVEEVVESYRVETPRRLQELHAALDRADRAGFAFLAHSLKGSSAQIGAIRTAALSGELEQKAPLASAVELALLLAELESEVGQTMPRVLAATGG